MPEQPLISERLSLRGLERADAPRITRLAGDWEVSRRLAAVPHPYDETMAITWIDRVRRQFEAGVAYHFAIERSEDALLIGGIGLESGDSTAAELGYWVGRPYWRRGYATEAAGRVVRFGFVDLGLDRIVAAPLPSNAASIAVLEKLGFTFQCREMQEFPAHGGIKEVLCYAMTGADFADGGGD